MARRNLAAVAAIAVALVWLYADTASSLVRQWASDDDYSHGFFVVPLALYFLWERRQAFKGLALAPAPSGLALLAVSLATFAAGRFGAELFLMRVSLLGVLAGLVLFLAGREHLRVAAFPLAFLLLMIPLPAIVFNQITFPLQSLAARLGELTIAAAGVPVLREGNVLQVPGRALEVAEACSGIRSLMSLFTIAVVLGHFAGGPGTSGGRRVADRRNVMRVALVAAAVPIAVLANAARVAGTGLACYLLTPAAADGFFHTFSGWLMFGVAFGGLLLAQRAICAVAAWPSRWFAAPQVTA